MQSEDGMAWMNERAIEIEMPRAETLLIEEAVSFLAAAQAWNGALVRGG